MPPTPNPTGLSVGKQPPDDEQDDFDAERGSATGPLLNQFIFEMTCLSLGRERSIIRNGPDFLLFGSRCSYEADCRAS